MYSVDFSIKSIVTKKIFHLMKYRRSIFRIGLFNQVDVERIYHFIVIVCFEISIQKLKSMIFYNI